MTTINSGIAAPSVFVQIDPKNHTILNKLELNDDSKLSIIGDGIINIIEIQGSHKFSLKNGGLLEVVG